mgnify:CR=1 FL=1|tara:strand:+ start:121 stop:597 length:477 start_codon:yes stop_codon:yes gene_type:complete
MNRKDMVVGREYLHCEAAFNMTYVFDSHVKTNKSWGSFSAPVSGGTYVFIFSHMKEAPTAKPEFEFDEEIEVSNNADFSVYVTCRFLADMKDCSNYRKERGDYSIVAIDGDGAPDHFKFARKVEPMVVIWLSESEFSSTTTARKIRKSLADKIIAGDV